MSKNKGTKSKDENEQYFLIKTTIIIYDFHLIPSGFNLRAFSL